MSDTPGSPAPVPVSPVDSPEEPCLPWPPVGASARELWNELVALVSGLPGRTSRSGALLRRDGNLERYKPLAAAAIRYESVTMLLDLLAASLNADNLDRRIAGLVGRDITGRGEAIALLERACYVRRFPPKSGRSDEDFCRSVKAVLASKPAHEALAALRDEVLRPVGKQPTPDGGGVAAAVQVLHTLARQYANEGQFTVTRAELSEALQRSNLDEHEGFAILTLEARQVLIREPRSEPTEGSDFARALSRSLGPSRWQIGPAVLAPVASESSELPTPSVHGGEEEVPEPASRTVCDPTPHSLDGPFDADGFRLDGVEVRFGRATKQYDLVLALWDREANRPTPPREIEEVITAVWGDENKTEDSTFRQLCTDTRARFQRSNCPLDIRTVQGSVQLVRV